ncbi:MAG: sigma-70 family RNA polymerase sigma factor [Betaproteobacteria bacterium]
MKSEPAPRKKVAHPRTRAGSVRAAVAKAPVEEPLLSGDDDRILRECLQGICRQDQSALGRFYDLTVGRVYGIALRIVRHADMAEEVVSDVYMQVWRDAHRYDDARGKVLGWLLVIARSRSLDLLRRQDEAFSHPEPYELVKEPESGSQNPHDLLAAARAGSAVHQAMLKLSPLQRQLLSLAFFRGLSHSEIVEHSGIPLGSVKTHIRRALGVLRDELGPHADGQW